MGITFHKRKGKDYEQASTKSRPGRSVRRNWLRRLYGNKDGASQFSKKKPTTPNHMVVVSGLTGDTEGVSFQTPLPLLRSNSFTEPPGPNKMEVDFDDDRHLRPSSLASSMKFSTPSISEEEVDAFYTCPSSPTKDSFRYLSALPVTPTKKSQGVWKGHQRQSETLLKRKEANYLLRQAFRDQSATGTTEGFLADPIPINFPSRRSPNMNKTDFESYLEQTLSKEVENVESNDEKDNITFEVGHDNNNNMSIHQGPKSKMPMYNTPSKC